MAKGANKARKSHSNKKTPQKSVPDFSDSEMDDEIDVFHKQRDVVPLDVDDVDMRESDEDDEHPVFPLEDDGTDDDDDDDDDEDDEDDGEDDMDDGRLAAKIKMQQRRLTAKIGGAKDETHDDSEGDENKRAVWGRHKSIYYDHHKGLLKGESSEDENLAEEDEVLRLQKEKAKEYSNVDHGLEDDSQDESEGDRTFEEILAKGQAPLRATGSHEADDETDTGFEVVKKDLNALSREEQMDIVYNSAPELVGLLAELNDAVEQLETIVQPILSIKLLLGGIGKTANVTAMTEMSSVDENSSLTGRSEKKRKFSENINVKEGESLSKTGMQYMELKKQLLLSYCQAITFHLLLKSEGQPVRDHPVIARLVEIKNLLDKVKQLDENLSFEIEDILKKRSTKIVLNTPKDTGAVAPIPLTNDSKSTVVSSETQHEHNEETEMMKMDHENRGKRNHENEQLGLQSVEMLKVRAALEEKLKQKGVYNLKASKPGGIKKNRIPLNGKLEALDDFDDDALDIEGNRNKTSNGHVNAVPSNRLSHLVTPQMKKPKVISGDDDLPKRDDIGKRRRKHEMRVLAGAGIKSDDDFQDDEQKNDDGESDSEPDLYKETKLKRAAKLAAKAQKYPRTAPLVPAVPETLDGKRHINYDMEKNRGLTRKRNKDHKNPRKNYKRKHKKKEVARKGQVREIRKPAGSYGGESTGINPGISRSVRL